MDKDTKSALASLCVMVCIFILGFLFILFKIGYIGKITVNDVYLGYIKKQNLNNYVQKVMEDEDYVFDNMDLDAAAVTYSFATDGFDYFDKMTFGAFLKGCIVGYDCHYEIVKVIDSDKVISWLNDYNTRQIQPVSAYIDKTDRFEIIPEEEGTVIDVNAIIKEITPYNYNHIFLDDFLLAPDVTTADLLTLCEDANTYATWSCTYTNGLKLESDIDKVWLDDKYGIIYDDSFIKENLENCIDSYNGKPNFITFKTTDGREVNVPNVTLEAKVDLESELDYLKKAMKEKQVLTDRVPCLLKDNADLSDTYIEVSIPQQHLWYYDKGELVLDSAVVTGQVGVHDTPLGCYYITQMLNGTYLEGEDYRDWVNRWMRLTEDGIGIHDASWRTEFGGEIYLTEGSHGCINMPNVKAAQLYDLVGLDTIVIIHN